MNKIEFINKLENLLKGIPYDDKKEIIYDYEEHFNVGITAGKSEEEISSSLGDPVLIAKQFRAEYLLNKAESTKSARNLWSAVLSITALGFLNLILIIPIYISLAAIIFSFYAASLAMTIGGMVSIPAVLAEPVFSDLYTVGINTGSAIFISIGIAALGLLAFIGTNQLAKLFYKGTVKYLKACQGIIRK